MATTVTTVQNAWGNIRVVSTGHFGLYFPGGSNPANTLVLYDPTGKELVRNAEALRDFDLGIDTNGFLFALYTKFQDGGPVPVRRWDTGIKVATTTTTPPPTQANAALKAAIVTKANEIETLANQLR